MNILSGALPAVPFMVNATGATWFGKWSFNWSTDTTRQLGGPWDTRDEACAAILKTGLYRLRPGSENNPHFDRIKEDA